MRANAVSNSRTGLALLLVVSAAGCGTGDAGSVPSVDWLSDPDEPLPALMAVALGTSNVVESAVCIVSRARQLMCWGGLLRDAPGGEFEDVFVSPSAACALDLQRLPTCWYSADSALRVAEEPLKSIGIVAFPGDQIHGAGLDMEGVPVSWGQRFSALPDTPQRDLSGGFLLSQDGVISTFDGHYIAEDPGYVQISGWEAGFVCALHEDGSVRCYSSYDGADTASSGTAGEAPTDSGSGAGADSNDPAFQIPDISILDRPDGQFTRIAMYPWPPYACGLTRTSELECWGRLEGRPGHVRFGIPFDIVTPEGTFVDFALDSDLVCGVTTDGELKCSGSPWW